MMMMIFISSIKYKAYAFYHIIFSYKSYFSFFSRYRVGTIMHFDDALIIFFSRPFNLPLITLIFHEFISVGRI